MPDIKLHYLKYINSHLQLLVRCQYIFITHTKSVKTQSYFWVWESLFGNGEQMSSWQFIFVMSQ